MNTVENLTVDNDPIPPRYDTVYSSLLTDVEVVVPSFDAEQVLASIHVPSNRSMRSFISKRAVADLKPSDDIVDIHSIGLDIERLTATARLLAGDAFRYVLRMGGAFNQYQASEGIVGAEELAISTLGLDASLYFHGTEQARRMNNHAILQNRVLSYVWDDTAREYGQKSRATAQATIDVQRQIPPISPRNVKYGILCGYIHDYGEVELGFDVPFLKKSDPKLVEIETANAVLLANKLHFPNGDSKRIQSLDMRVESEGFYDRELNKLLRDEVGEYLHPAEIANAIYGTEKMIHGQVVRGEIFAATERGEYILSGIRAFDALEFNFEDIQSKPELAQGVLRLGVDTFINSLEIMTAYADKYVASYDFLRQNSRVISHHVQNVLNVILGEECPEEIYSYDPFGQYKSGGIWADVMSYEEGQKKFKEVGEIWTKWNTKTSLMRTLWENYIGTTHELTEAPRDVSYLQYTAQRPIRETAIGNVIVRKPVIDMFGVGTDEASQSQHLRLAA